MSYKTSRLILASSLGLLASQAALAGGPYSFFPLIPCRIVDTWSHASHYAK